MGLESALESEELWGTIPVRSVVPQGSVVGLYLFLFIVSDLQDIIEAELQN